MANWNNPTLSSEIPDFLEQVKGRDEDSATMFDQGVFSSIPENSIRFNVASGVFQRREGGSWVTKTLSNDALNDVLSNAGSFGSSIAIPQITINSKGRVTVAGTNTVRSASTSQTGVVQLNNTTTSTSTTQAATANSVNLAKDAADSAQSSADSAQSSANSAQSSADAASNKATPKTLTGGTSNTADSTGHTHAITTSNATNSTSTTQVANSAAVKSANDNANGRVPSGRTISTGTGLSGGGNLTSNRTLSISNSGVGSTQLHSTQRMTTANVLGQNAELTAGAVGTMAFARAGFGNLLSSPVDFGETVSGARLRPTNAHFQTSSSTLNGTWRCLGFADDDNNNTSRDTLWVRIS